MKKILIVTTEGCEACEIAKNNVSNAVIQTGITIELEYKDYHNVQRKLIIENKIKDFPAVLYIVDDKVVHKSIGTFPSAVYLRWIDMYFKI